MIFIAHVAGPDRIIVQYLILLTIELLQQAQFKMKGKENWHYIKVHIPSFYMFYFVLS